MIRYLTELSMEAFTEAARNVPYQQVESELFPGVDLWIRRDDLIDPIISGNKAYKLIFNLLEAREQGKDTIVTCGGAWSNHIHATAAAGQRFGFKTIGIIRGERPPVLSAMLQDAERFGMELRFVSRTIYRKRAEEGFWAQLGLSGERYWYVPEGGANEQGARGVQLLGEVVQETSPVDFVEYWVAAGTGLTTGALARVTPKDVVVKGVAVLKASPAIQLAAGGWSGCSPDERPRAIEIEADWHCGGYAKVDLQLIQYSSILAKATEIPMDWIYTMKAGLGLSKLSALCNFVSLPPFRRKKILLFHTGGLQGNRGVG
ncbi:1-aminocyclopropane-1-carboxylate deaminase/D-cysteine desulfhydrase [Microbulbifer sp. ARAS458-1]|uniref:1-aminocyclopropane-1-carboxylate deaminase/D-cysteine desulfhydrase n=1 Tax=Microbulbifer sp. ARAS458-1 TaxID=3140242 RepID=UPI0038782F00